MDKSWRADTTVSRVLAEFAERSGTLVGRPQPFATSSSHSIFYTAESDRGLLMVKVCVDTLLAGRSDAVQHEYYALRTAWLTGLAPRPYYADPGCSLLIQQFVPGVSNDDWTGPGLRPCLKLAARLMRVDTAGSRLDTAHLSYSDDVDRSGELLDRAGAADPSLRSLSAAARSHLSWLTDLAARARPALDLLPLVLSHNDVSPENTLADESGRHLLIDFETAALSRPDFLFGQIAVDALIEDHLAGRPPRLVTDLWAAVGAEVGWQVPASLQRVRTLERLLYNAAYGLRQVAEREKWRHEPGYVERKLDVARWCAAALGQFREEWTGELGDSLPERRYEHAEVIH